MRSAVEIKPLDDTILLGLHATGDAKSETLAALNARSILIANHHNDHDRFFILTSEKIEDRFKTINEWNRLDIEQNLPQLYIETYEALIPQSVNLDIVGGVNFKKGCFPGQEIVARVKYRGKPKTRMIGVKSSPAKPVELGAPVFIEGRNSAAGQVVNIANNDGFTLLSISIPVTHIYEGNIYLDEARTLMLERLSCPYEITD
jgi:folate-binding protein YgfZ